MSDYPATTMSMNKGKWYVYLTIPQELREHFPGRKQLKRSTGTSDLHDARRRQHGIATGLYAQLDACKPDIRDMISDLLGWIGDADEVQRMDDEGHLEGLIQYHKNLEDGENPENDVATDVVSEQGAEALEVYREWKAKTAKAPVASDAVLLSVATGEYLATKPYGPAKTTRDCELSLGQFQDFTGDLLLTDVTAVMIHQYAENLGSTASRKTIAKKISYVKRLFDHGVRKGWVPHNVFAGLVLDKKVGRPLQSYRPFTSSELEALFKQDMKPQTLQVPDPTTGQAASSVFAVLDALDYQFTLHWSQTCRPLERHGGDGVFKRQRRPDITQTIQGPLIVRGNSMGIRQVCLS